MTEEEIKGQVKVIRLNGREGDVADDPLFGPWVLTATFRPPSSWGILDIALNGGRETLIVRGKSREALDALIALNEFGMHPRLQHLRVGYLPKQEGDE